MLKPAKIPISITVEIRIYLDDKCIRHNDPDSKSSDPELTLLREIKNGKGNLTVAKLAKIAKLTHMQTRLRLAKFAQNKLVEQLGIGSGKRYYITKLGKMHLEKQNA